jgi:hypothetical protein
MADNDNTQAESEGLSPLAAAPEAVEETPVETPAEHPMAQYVVPDYEPHFDRSGTTRRVLGHVTDDEHVGRGPRNTVKRLFEELEEDPHTRTFKTNVTDDGVERVPFVEQDVQDHLDKLTEAGLLEKRDDGTYGVTRAGVVELVN